MIRKLFIPLVPLVPLVLLSLATPAAFGQATQIRIAVANPGRIFNEMQEFKELRENLEAEGIRLRTQEKEKREALQNLQNQRNNLKADTPQWDELNNKLMEAAGDFQLWVQQTKMKAERDQKRKMKMLFAHIEQAIGEIAQRDGYDLVLAEQRPQLPENLDEISLGDLRGAINSRNVMYVSKKVDISDAVIALLDAKHKGKGGAGAAAPAPGKRAAPAAAPRQGGTGTGNTGQ